MRVPAAVILVALVSADTGSAQGAAPPPCRPHHVRLYAYAGPDIRPRHAAVVEKALEQRARVHVSGFAERDGAWDRNTSMPVAWPFVAVLEYDGRGEPRAWIDWFRRAKGSRDGGAWAKDPADQRYARHMSDAYATAYDDRFAYLAVVDTPTGVVVFGNEWVVRGRVVWDDDHVARRAGVQIWFERGGEDPVDWYAEQSPLVGWIPLQTPGRRGAARGSVPVASPERQLAVIGTRVVFTLPPIPADVVPARGFPRGEPGGRSGGAQREPSQAEKR